MTTIDAPAAVDRILADRPTFHGQGTVVWFATAGTLAFLARSVRPGDRTLETGAGASTVVFAAAGATHTAISPAADEHQRIAEYCSEIGVDASRVRFIAQPSDEVLPAIEGEPFDVVFIDGAHSFPHPVVDWHFATRRLRVGGILVLDDVPIPAVAVVYRAMQGDPGWAFVELLNNRTAVFHKVADPPEGDYWRGQAFNRRPDYSFLPPSARMRAAARAEATAFVHTLDDKVPALGRLVRRLAGR